MRLGTTAQRARRIPRGYKMTRNLVCTLVDSNYSDVLQETIKSIQAYSTKIKADLLVCYGGYPYIHRHELMKRLDENQYEKTLYIDCDILIHPESPSIFDEPFVQVGYPKASDTEYKKSLFDSIQPVFGDKVDSNVFVYSGVTVGYTHILKDICSKVCDLWYARTYTTEWWSESDEVYLCQVIKEFYPDFYNLPDPWLVNTDLAKTKPYYFAHPFFPKEQKIVELRKLKTLS